MNKSELNREIVLCRSLVKKAKVRVIRKLLKKIKILRSCKNENLKEKKFKKARRLIAEMHEMKSLRPDYVMKFALLTETYDYAGSNTKQKRKRNACAKLAKHKEIVQKVNDIRSKFLNWQEVLPLMIQSAKKRKSNEFKVKNETKASEAKENNLNNLKETPSPGEENEDDFASEKEMEKDDINRVVKSKIQDQEKDNKVEDAAVENQLTSQKSAKIKKDKRRRGEKEKNPAADSKTAKEGNFQSKSDEEGALDEKDSAVKESDAMVIKKVEDPFFVEKKVIAPKLMQVASEDEKLSPKIFDGDPTREPRKSAKRNQTAPKGCSDKFEKGNLYSDLHPSWQAKKIQMIKPFQGKKIIFK